MGPDDIENEFQFQYLGYVGRLPLVNARGARVVVQLEL
jgi:hypothetical protein